MQKFRLSIEVLDDHEGSFTFLDKWIRLAIEKKVEELDFDVKAYRRAMYTLPQEIFSAKSVTTLKLGGCKLENPFIIHSLKSLTLKDARISEEVLQKITSQCTSLEDLFLSDYQKFHALISKFPLLEDLNVCRCDPLEQIKISSHLLKKFSIGYCYGLKAIDIDTPNLLSFTYDTCPIPVFSINAPCLWEVGFVQQILGTEKFDADTHWYLNIKKFLNASNQIEYLSLYVDGQKNSFSFDEFRKCSPSPPKEVGNLHLQTDFTSNYDAFLDGVLSICYPRILSVNNSCQADCFFIEWLHEKLINKDDNCCNIHD
ncbi:hypothetical protein EZV62_003966 [Acer yangbiense]|uniref:FBD domain-containing protein n=1 Tax=Acer yangbiense TaxID=1000413 RepID=A0A5C7IIR4_9ROSI|nr:hypothetical protein EZV62_003966 [Acer yangbiense]